MSLDVISSTGLSSRQYWPRTHRDIFEVACILRRVLPQTTVFKTLEEAEYWTMTSTFKQDKWVVDEKKCNISPPYVVSPPVTGSLSSPVRRVVFHIESHDQGWSDETAHHGTHAGSYTWFDVGISKASTDSNSLEDEQSQITTNLNAVEKTTKYRIAFGRLYGEREAKWMSKLGPGDKVSILVKARFPGWVNYVYAAGIEVFTTCLHPVGET